MIRKGYIGILLFTMFVGISHAQTKFSLATDFSLQRSFKEQQKYWAVGQTVYGHFHLTKKDGIYASVAYFSNGRFRNQLTATAKDPGTLPQEQPYTNRSKMNFKQVSFGWRHYITGAYDLERSVSLYGITGLGLMLGRVENSHSVAIDTADYNVPVLSGKANFKRLTLDLGLGLEIPVGADIFFYTEAKTYIPVTYYPSTYIFASKYAPLTASIGLGFRILFNQ